MLCISSQKPALLVGAGVGGRVAGPGAARGVGVVAPLREVVGELVATRVGARVLEVDDDQLLVLVGGEQQRRRARWLQAEEVAVLRLCGMLRIGTVEVKALIQN